MTEPTARATFHAWVRREIAPFLAVAGWQRRDLVFERPPGANSALPRFVKRRWSSRRLSPALWPACTHWLLVLLVAFAAVGCTGSRRQQAVSIYLWNETATPLGFLVRPQTNPATVGEIDPGISSAGCGFWAENWVLGITDEPGPSASVLREVPGAAFPGAAADVWIHVTKDRAVEAGRGVPPWWNAERQVCRPQS